MSSLKTARAKASKRSNSSASEGWTRLIDSLVGPKSHGKETSGDNRWDSHSPNWVTFPGIFLPKSQQNGRKSFRHEKDENTHIVETTRCESAKTNKKKRLSNYKGKAKRSRRTAGRCKKPFCEMHGEASMKAHCSSEPLLRSIQKVLRRFSC